MRVSTVKEAWNLASRLFPTDYDYDELMSCLAGYSVYSSTSKNSSSHISDLGDRLELTYDNGQSENIWIDENSKKGANKMIMKKYMVYMDDGQDCFKVPVPAENKEEASRYVLGYGEVIAVKDITDDFPIYSDEVFSALKKSGFGETKIKLIVRSLEAIEICYPF